MTQKIAKKMLAYLSENPAYNIYGVFQNQNQTETMDTVSFFEYNGKKLLRITIYGTEHFIHATPKDLSNFINFNFNRAVIAPVKWVGSYKYIKW